MGTDVADPELMKWSISVGRTATCLDNTLEGWTVPLRFVPGDGWYYGGAIDWAGVAIERITGMKLDSYLYENVLRPLGMADTTFYRDALGDKMANRTAPCSMRNVLTGELSVVPTPYPAEPPVLSAGGGLYMTAADHAKVLQSLLKSSAGEGGGILSEETVHEMFRPQLKPSQRAILKMVTDTFHDAMVYEFSPGMPLDHGIGGIINMEDEPGKRRKGSMMWQGMCNGHWVSLLDVACMAGLLTP